MKPEEALVLLDQAVAQIATSREGHVRLQQAILTLKEVIKPKKAGAKEGNE